jgi:two-component system CheB/CheR fusion protein
LLDIDQLRQSQQRLIDAKDFASSVVESVPVPIVVLNQDCTIHSENVAFRELTQMKAEELDGFSLPDLAGRLWGMNRLRERLDALLKPSSSDTIEFEHASATSQSKNLLVRGCVLSKDGSRGLLLIIEDITLRREAEVPIARQKVAIESEIEVSGRKLSGTLQELRGLTAHLFTIQEEERERVARDLHDDISQRLSLVEILLNDIRVGKASQGIRAKIEKARDEVQSINTDLRHLSHRLHPAILYDLGLSAALKALVTEFGEREEMPATYLTRNLPDSWSQQAATAIYRIAQEALLNVAKHAGKTHVKMMLSGDTDRLRLKVMDFGIGFDQESEQQIATLGTISMRERARLAGGTLIVTSKLGEGTTVLLDVPIDHHA